MIVHPSRVRHGFEHAIQVSFHLVSFHTDSMS